MPKVYDTDGGTMVVRSKSRNKEAHVTNRKVSKKSSARKGGLVMEDAFGGERKNALKSPAIKEQEQRKRRLSKESL